MNIPETFYIALCVAILLLGVIYWFWTQIQYLQKKVNLLDNVVYEMKTFVSNLPGHSSTPAFRAEVENHISRQSPNEEIYHSPPPSEEVYHPPPDSIAGDLESERVASEIEFEPFSGAIEKTQEDDNIPTIIINDSPDDLQPGGLANTGAKQNGSISDSMIESPLSSMTLKELRRMADSNGIPGASELKKRDLIRALRDKVSTVINNTTDNNEAPKIISFDEIDAPSSE